MLSPDHVAGRARTRVTGLRMDALVFGIAALTRLTVIFRDSRSHGSFGYDAPVYFSAADAFSHGRLPYRDFIMLHPPLLMLVLTPFAWLTRLTTDAMAFTIANAAFALLGALNAVLVLRVGRQLGLGARASAAGALFYAVWFGAIGSEYLTKLEPLGNAMILLALVAALAAQRTGRAWLHLAAGSAGGLAVSVKIWWIVPVVGVFVWHLMATRRTRVAPLFLAGTIGAAVLVDGPFFAAAPRQMWTSVVVDQLNRPASHSRLARLADLTTIPRLGYHVSHPALGVCTLVFGVLVAILSAMAWTVRTVRPAVLLLAAQAVVVMAAPSWFSYYCDYLAVALSLVVAGGVAYAGSSRRRGAVPLAVVAGASVITTVVLVFGTSVVHPFRGAALLAAAVAHVRCVMTDTPSAQIELDALSRGLASGCPNWVDVTGPTYGRDRSPTASPRKLNPTWQRDLRRYLRSGDAIIIARASGTGLSAATRHAISRDGVIARAGGVVVYRVRH